MKREFLTGLGVTEDVIDKIMAENGKDIEAAKAKYADYVEKGTKPHWTSVRNLESWARFRGINPYVLQRSIARKGTKAHPFEQRTAQRAIAFATKDMQQQLDKSMKEIL